jgi:hypothetical protein
MIHRNHRVRRLMLLVVCCVCLGVIASAQAKTPATIGIFGSLGMSLHASVLETAVFENVKLESLPAEHPSRTRIRSRISIYDLRDKSVHVVYMADKLIEAPNWSPDGKYLLANSDGLLFRYALWYQGGSAREDRSGRCVPVQQRPRHLARRKTGGVFREPGAVATIAGIRFAGRRIMQENRSLGQSRKLRRERHVNGATGTCAIRPRRARARGAGEIEAFRSLHYCRCARYRRGAVERVGEWNARTRLADGDGLEVRRRREQLHDAAVRLVRNKNIAASIHRHTPRIAEPAP